MVVEICNWEEDFGHRKSLAVGGCEEAKYSGGTDAQDTAGRERGLGVGVEVVRRKRLWLCRHRRDRDRLLVRRTVKTVLLAAQAVVLQVVSREAVRCMREPSLGNTAPPGSSVNSDIKLREKVSNEDYAKGGDVRD